jgi:hypothetical protein
MHTIRHHFIFRTLWGFMALYLLNFSVDMSDLRPWTSPEDLSVNDIESVAELVAEFFFGFDNAFAENDEPGSETLEAMDGDLKDFIFGNACNLQSCFAYSIIQRYSYFSSALSNQVVHTAAPPPEFGLAGV